MITVDYSHNQLLACIHMNPTCCTCMQAELLACIHTGCICMEDELLAYIHMKPHVLYMHEG